MGRGGGWISLQGLTSIPNVTTINDTCQPPIGFSIRILVLLSVRYVDKPLSSRSHEINIITYEVFP